MNIYKLRENGITVEKAKSLENMSFIETGKKLNGKKIYKGYMFYSDSQYRIFKGYFYKGYIKQLNTKKNIKTLEKNVCKSFKLFDCKDIKINWDEWYQKIS